MTPKRLILMLSIGLLGLLAFALFSTATVSAGPLPPRPTPGPTPVIIVGRPTQGALIELHASAAQPTWWLVVQWQDEPKNWNTVTGWQGSFDSIDAGTGVKTWWVAPSDMGTGPFRWAIFDAKGGKLLATSAAFNLHFQKGTKIVSTVHVQ